MISTSKITLNQNNLKILRPKVTKNLTNLCKKFCESPPTAFFSIAYNFKMIFQMRQFANNINFMRTLLALFCWFAGHIMLQF